VKFGKVFKVFKKGAKATSKRKGKGAAAAGGFEWPSGVRIGLYGHDNSGKTVYFTVLNEECKISRNLQISVTDNATAAEFLTNYRRIWGVGTKTDVGTVVDLREEKKFPDPTKGDKVLQFNAVVDRKKKIPVVTYDYNGQAVSISGEHELSEKVVDFMSGCDGVLFFYDPKMLGSEARTQAHVASFVNFLEQLAPLNRRLPIPVALVVTKADILPGFSSESQTVLINAEDEHFFAEDYEVFLDRVLTSNKIASNSTWTGTVRDILVKLKEFLKVVVGRTLDFQIFFVSSTGQTPEKIGADVGRSIYAPPSKMSPVGIKEPFYWLLNSIRRNRGVSRIRTLAKYTTLLSLIWIGVFSLPCLYHFQFLLSRATQVEDNILRSHDNNKLMVSSKERSKIISTYDRYEHAWVAKWFFDRFRVAAGQLREQYRGFGANAAKTELDRVIAKLTGIVRDENHWPVKNPSSDSLVLDSAHREVETDLNSFRQWDDTSTLYARSGRALTYWDLFKESIRNPAESDSAWKKITEQVEHDNNLYGKDLSRDEKALCEALTQVALAQRQIVVETETVQRASTKFEELIANIMAHQDDPEYLLVTAVEKLKKFRRELRGDPTRGGAIDSINTYLSNADRFFKNQKYSFSLTYCPEGYHVHILVKKGGKTGEWRQGNLFRKGGTGYSVTWRKGDHVLIALEKNHINPADETWGKNPTDLKILDNPLSIFDMNGEIEFASGEKISISFDRDPKQDLPKF
jgi:hypothetical protein